MEIKNAYACGSPIRKPVVQAAAKSVGAEFHPEANPGDRGGNSIIWGKIRGAPELIAKVRGRGGVVYEMDNGYRGRNKYYRITKNADQHVGLEDRPSDRWEALVKKFGYEIKPWTKGSHILIALSTEWHFKFHKTSLQKWLDYVVLNIRKHSDREIRIRPKDAKGPIENDLEGCHALITYMSMAALDAFQMGVPVFCDEKCAVRPLSRGTDELDMIENPLYPDNREQLMHTLAYHQFTVDELEKGVWKECCGFS